MFKSRRIATSGGDKFRNDKSLAFDGTNDFVDCGTTMQSTLRGDFTIVAWIRPTDGRTGGVDTIIGSKNSSGEDWFYAGIHGSGSMTFYYRANDDPAAKTSNIVFPDGDSGWHHVAWTVKKSTSGGLGFYYDGKLVNTDTTVGCDEDNWIDFTTTENVYLGGYNDGGSVTNVMPGKISEIAVYNAELSASEVSQMYNGREPFDHKEWGRRKNLVHWWRFGDGTLDRWGSNPDDSFNRFLVTDEVNPTIGNNAVVNGEFSSGSGWTLGSGWSISGGSASRAAGESSNSAIEYGGNVVTADRTYKYSFDFDIASGNCSAYLGGTTLDSSFTGSGTNSGYVTAANGGEFTMYGLTSAEVTKLDNVQIWAIGGGAGTTANMEKDDVVGDVP